MIQNADHLALFIKDAIQARGTCRIYQDALDKCWFLPGAGGRVQQQALILEFASRNGWVVRVHTPGGYGIVADFEMTSGHGPGSAER